MKIIVFILRPPMLILKNFSAYNNKDGLKQDKNQGKVGGVPKKTKNSTPRVPYVFLAQFSVGTSFGAT